MSIYIENQYNNSIDLDYENIIITTILGALDYIECPFECEISVTIVDNQTIKGINSEQRNIDNPTDVLSFPMLDYVKAGDFNEFNNMPWCFNPESGELNLGDIVICYDKVISQSLEYNHSQKRELAFLVAHSMLHLFGFDHIKDDERIKMEKMQNNILEELGITRED
jgi:probable rRNA maturation factor